MRISSDVQSVDPGRLFSDQTACQRRELGKKDKDTIAPPDQQKESWGECGIRYLLLVPNLMWMCVKAVLCVLSCGLYCADKPAPEPVVVDMKKELESYQTLCESPEATKQDKEKAWTEFCEKCPDAKHKMVEEYVTVQQLACVGPKGTKNDKATWDERNRESTHKLAENLFDEGNSSLVGSFLSTLPEDQPAAK
ncbi:MAG: hypothetical protein KR126chlam3_00683 [Chlamydiae bacterium]|nr:hypothetical protein [Chlamydiota bacterium]